MKNYFWLLIKTTSRNISILYKRELAKFIKTKLLNVSCFEFITINYRVVVKLTYIAN